MAKIIKKLKENARTVFQFCYAAVTNGYVYGFLNGKIFKGNLKQFCVPGLNCYSCPGAIGSCPIGSFQAVLSDRKFKFAFYVAGILMFFGAVFGRFVCGWLCPLGLLQDLLYKIPFPKKLKKLPGDKILKLLKYVIFAVFVVILPLTVLDIIGQGSPWFCKYICPSGTLFGAVPLAAADSTIREALGGLFGWKMFVLVFLVLLSVAVYRPFCRYLCPLGAVYSVFNPIAFYRYKVDTDKCTKCGKCQRKCKMDIKVYEKPNDPECIRCGDCIKACPYGAICPSVKLKNKESDKIKTK
ncbi:MAG: 4Fe-4S binding protein [Acutalibacteraceae bacterium]